MAERFKLKEPTPKIHGINKLSNNEYRLHCESKEDPQHLSRMDWNLVFNGVKIKKTQVWTSNTRSPQKGPRPQYRRRDRTKGRSRRRKHQQKPASGTSNPTPTHSKIPEQNHCTPLNCYLYTQYLRSRRVHKTRHDHQRKVLLPREVHTRTQHHTMLQVLQIRAHSKALQM